MSVVNDLLEGYSYIITRSEAGYQLTFMLKDGRQVIVAVEPTGDTALLAQRIAERLMESGNRLVLAERIPKLADSIPSTGEKMT
jgi:hypothetical protein